MIRNVNVWNGERFERKDVKASVELDGKGLFSFPCFVDYHIHVISLGLKLSAIADLEKEDLKDLLKRKRDILIGRGWEAPPPVKILNSVDYPVALIRKCGHSAILNDRAKEILKLKENIVYEEDVERIYSLLRPEDFRRAFEVAQNELLRVGITTVHSDDLHGMDYETLVDILRTSKIRIFEKLALREPESWMFKRLTDRVSVVGIKLFADGSIGSRTAYMKEPYLDTGERGILLLSDETLERVLSFADSNGLRVYIHAIGDGAVEMVSNHLEKHPNHVLVHAQFVPEESLEKLRKTVFAVQPHFYFEDLPILKSVRTNSLEYPFFDLYKMGFDVRFSSDAPVSPHDPRYVAQHAMRMGFSQKETIEIYTRDSKDSCLYETPNPLESYPVVVVLENGEVAFTR